MPSVSIAIQPEIFERFSDLNFKPSQALAEFVDNAIQSYLDFKNNITFNTSDYKLVIDIDIEWSESQNNRTFAKSIMIRDNAAGMALDKFESAFETGKRPAFNNGLNEYGMGMKTAAYWLSQKWSIISKSFSEDKERTVSFDVDDIVKNSRTTLDFQEKHISGSQSYTIIRLEKLHQKNNFTKRMLASIIQDLASIYRAFLRRGEIQINVNQEALTFKDPEILKAPYYSDPEGKPLEWKVQIYKDLFKRQIKGFIGILSEMSEKRSGLVIMRRGRVIVGESSDHLYHPEILFGSYKNGFVYKRLYGEIEIEGFSASFNKNGFSNLEEFETMLKLLKSTLRVEGYDLIKQAKELRVNPSSKTPKDVTIQWNFDNGTQPHIDTIKANDKISIPPIPIKDGYTFKGWTPNVPSKAANDITFTAVWKEIVTSIQTHMVSWVLNNEQPDINETYHSGDKLNIPPSPYKTGFTFIKWTPTPVTKVDSNAVYTAQWIKDAKLPNESLIAERVFLHNGNNTMMQLIRSKSDAPLLSINMEKIYTEGTVIGLLNIETLPIANKAEISEDVKNILLSIAIGMFETQMKGEDTCDALMKNIK